MYVTIISIYLFQLKTYMSLVLYLTPPSSTGRRSSASHPRVLLERLSCSFRRSDTAIRDVTSRDTPRCYEALDSTFSIIAVLTIHYTIELELIIASP